MDLVELKEAASVIKNEVTSGQNSADRIGKWLIDLIDFLQSVTGDGLVTETKLTQFLNNYYTKTAIDEKLNLKLNSADLAAAIIALRTYYTASYIDQTFAKKTDLPDLSSFAKKDDIPDIGGIEASVTIKPLADYDADLLLQTGRYFMMNGINVPEPKVYLEVIAPHTSFIVQKATLSNGSMVSRVYNGSSWSEWT